MPGEIIIPYQGLREQQTSERKLLIPKVMNYFDEQQLLSSSKPIPGREILQERLEALSIGKPVDVLCFNCIDFTFQANGKNYPQARAIEDTKTALVECYREEMEGTISQLKLLGNPRVTIIIPDSELRDENVFNFSQREQQRFSIGQRIKKSLAEKFTDQTIAVSLWSDFLKERDLPDASVYTKNNLPLVMSKYASSVKRMFGETERYLQGKGLEEEEVQQINPAELTIRAAWYLAMYAGEGNAMADLASGNNHGAIVLNFENDGKVLAWYQRGAQGLETTKTILPIVTPADTTKFKLWKEQSKSKKTGVVYERKGV